MITHLVFAYAVDWGWLHIGPLKCGGNIGIGVGASGGWRRTRATIIRSNLVSNLVHIGRIMRQRVSCRKGVPVRRDREYVFRDHTTGKTTAASCSL